MTNITQNPLLQFAGLNLDRHFSDFKLAEKVIPHLTGDDLITISIKNAIKTGVPARKILLTLRDMAVDNCGAITNIFGLQTASEILNYE